VSTDDVAYGNTLEAHLEARESLFLWVRRSEHSELKVTIRKVLAFSLFIDYIGAGLSFRQATHIFSSTADRTGLAELKGVRENEVVKFVRIVVGVNLHALSDLLNNREC
jgi:hypothetical protein